MREGGFDIVDAHEPHVPGIGVAAIKHAVGLTVATFHTTTERTFVGPIRESRRERYRARIDALIATSPRAAELAAAIYLGDYQLLPRAVDEHSSPVARGADRSCCTGMGRRPGGAVTRQARRQVSLHHADRDRDAAAGGRCGPRSRPRHVAAVTSWERPASTIAPPCSHPPT